MTRTECPAIPPRKSFRPNMPLLLVVAGGLAAASCSERIVSHETSKQQAEQRWSSVRGRIKQQIASQSFTQGQLDEAQKQLDEAMALDPMLPDGLLLQTRILLERGEIASAQQALQTAVKKGADGADTDYLTGVIAQRYGRFEEALTAYRRASEREPRNAHYVSAIAETLVALDRPAEALALVEKRWTDFEHNATLRATAGEIHLLMGRYEQAADVYRDAVRIAPDDQTLKCQLGLALSLAGEHAEAITVLEPICRKGGREAETPGYLLVALGRAYHGLDRHDEARSTLRAAVQASPESLSARTWLARAALAGGDLVTAHEAAEKAAEIGAGAPEPLILLGYICLRQGDGAAAARALEQALRKQPNDAMVLYLLAQARRIQKTDARVKPAVHLEANPP